MTGRIIALLCLNLTILWLLLYLTNLQINRHAFHSGNTDSVLLRIGQQKCYDAVILGASHAHGLSRKSNHYRVEKILGKKLISLAKGRGAGGIKNQYIYFSYFIKKKNRADRLIYFIDPFVFYNDKMDHHHYIYNDEAFRTDFLWHIVSNGISMEITMNYLRFKLKKEWWHYRPDVDTIQEGSLTGIDSVKIKKRLSILYPEGMSEATFQQKVKYLEKIIELARKNKMSIVFVVPPTLMGKLPGHEHMLTTLRDLAPECHIYDFSNVMEQPNMYYDHDHLNTEGVIRFSEKYLALIFNGI